MANVLQFSLGMATGQFISTLATAQGKVQAFVGGMLSLGAIVEGVQAQIEKGASLEVLHKRTDASVSDLVKMQAGFKAVGLSADDVAPSVSFMQRALGGVNEMGESTKDIFYRLGLNLGNLKHSGAAEAMQTILGKLGQLNQNDAAKAASSIFGRMGGANLLVAARSMDDFQHAMGAAAQKAAEMERAAATFQKIQVLLISIKDGVGNLFLGLAEGIAPFLKIALEGIKSMEASFLRIGKFAGQIFSGVAEAFKEGKITELLQLSFAAGVEYFTNLLAGTIGSAAFWQGIWEVMAGSFTSAFAEILMVAASIGSVLTAAFDTAFQKLYEWMGKIPKVGKMLGLENYHAQSFGENFIQRKNEAAGGMSVLNEMQGWGLGKIAAGNSKIGGAVMDASKNAGGPAQAALENFFNGLVKRAPQLMAEKSTGSAPKLELPATENKYKPEFTAFEKMGFVMGGGNSLMKRSEDLLAQIARNTGRALAGPAPAPAFANAL
jgi:hypothetical protein